MWLATGRGRTHIRTRRPAPPSSHSIIFCNTDQTNGRPRSTHRDTPEVSDAIA